MDPSRESTVLAAKLEGAWQRRVKAAAEWNARLESGELKPSLFKRIGRAMRAISRDTSRKRSVFGDMAQLMPIVLRARSAAIIAVTPGPRNLRPSKEGTAWYSVYSSSNSCEVIQDLLVLSQESVKLTQIYPITTIQPSELSIHSSAKAGFKV
ncbi:hypothetical protein C8R48DRAFT_785825 [Suillus tomentosus]|nr:hypothetical protein C8R48DRAFT_785825 [Suillus tomentosus]